MTRKENLLIEIYNIRNHISEIKGNKLVAGNGRGA